MNKQAIDMVAKRIHLDAAFTGKIVLVTAMKDGVKMYMGNGFQPDKRRAFPYDYTNDKVGDQVFQAGLMGMTLEIEEAS